MQVRNLVILVLCQLISATGSIVVVTLSGIIGADLAPDQSIATLPVSLTIVALAVTTIPAAMLMRRIGRRHGFALSSCSAAVATVIAVFALSQQSYWLFVLAAAMYGINMAFTQQYRFAAAENVEERYVPRAVSLVLIGSLGGAVVGPELTMRGQFWIDGVQYGGTMAALAVLFVVQALLMLSMRPSDHAFAGAGNLERRPIGKVARQPLFVVAVMGGAVGYGLMALVMTATPLSMHINDGYSLEQTARVIQAHVFGMYAPSLFAGFIIERIGVTRLMFAGAIALLATSIVGLQGHTVLHYWWALVLLGVGWNFLYVGATTMLTYTYAPEERFTAQATNDFLVFGSSATASMLAGTIMHFFGWSVLMLVPVPFLILICVGLLVVRRDPLLPGRSLRAKA